MPSKVILIDASPRRANDGVAEAVRLAGGGGQFPYHYGGQHYRAGVVQLPTIVTAITFDGGDFGSGGVPQAAELQWAASRKADLAAIANYFWIDAPITVRIGDENSVGTLPAVTITGKVLSATVDGGVVKLQLSDPAADLKKPLLTSRFGGTGGADGPAEWNGRIKTRVWGRVWNLEGERFDPANNIYCFADPARPILSFDALRDKGASASAVSVLAWQGSVAATFAALQAAVAPQGGGVACPSIACVKWWTQPAGALTADLKGEVGAGYVETTAQIVQRIVQAGPNTPFAAGTIAAAQAARTAPVGWVAKDDSTSTASMIEELLGNVSLLWLLNASGEITIRGWIWGAGVASGVSQSVKRTAVFAPVGTRKLGYKRNETQMARGDLAAVVLTSDVIYPDGVPITQAIADAYDLAAARGKVWTGPQPSIAESNPGDTWIDGDGVFYDRVAGGILLGGFVITLGGFRPSIYWTKAVVQPVVAASLTATWAGLSGTGKPEDNADVTSIITGISDITIAADFTGAVTVTLPKTQAYKLVRNGVDLTTSAAWSVAVVSGTLSASIGAATGVLSIAASSGTLTSATVRLTAVYAGSTRTLDVKITKENAAAPSTGSGGTGTSATGTYTGTTSSTSMVAIGPELSITVGSGGQAVLTASYDFDVFASGTNLHEFARWYRWNGSAYVAIGSEVQSSVGASWNAVDYESTSGSGACNFTDTGLTAGSVQKYKLYMRSGSFAANRHIYGSCAAVGS